jgi:hypothetical protein
MDSDLSGYEYGDFGMGLVVKASIGYLSLLSRSPDSRNTGERVRTGSQGGNLASLRKRKLSKIAHW